MQRHRAVVGEKMLVMMKTRSTGDCRPWLGITLAPRVALIATGGGRGGARAVPGWSAGLTAGQARRSAG